MILIISKIEELSTDPVIDWIDYLGGNFIRINGDDYSKHGNLNVSVVNSELKIEYKGIEIPIDKIKIVWNWRWETFLNDNYLNHEEIDYLLQDKLISYQRFNNRSLKETLFYQLSEKKWLPGPLNITPNKLVVLQEANKFGFHIPKTKICSTKKELLSFADKHKDIIAKDIYNPFYFSDSKNEYGTITSVISKQKIIKLPENFAPTLFQVLVKKRYEVRVFYLDGVCYSMAIFSQNDDQTKVDFKNYNFNKPNRNVPYNLPSKIEKAINLFMKKMKLTSGSIDLIKDTEGNYVFLEVNPVGQFGMTSDPCNYNLYKKIAQYLINNGHE